jgi:hypothetical protein
MKPYRTHLTSFAGVLGFEVSRYFAINDRACLTKLFFARTGIKPASCKAFGFRNRSQMGSIKERGSYLMSTLGKMELTIKINEFPADVQTVENGWKQFDLDCDGQLVRVSVKPKVFKKLEQAQADYPMWVAAIAGKMGEQFEGGFVLEQPNIQVFERKPKEPKEATAAATT